MAIIDVLKYDGPNNVLAWKWRPQNKGGRHEELGGDQRDHDIRQEELRYGTQLIVNQSQQAVFVKDGRVVGLFDAGRYTLSAKNLPVIHKIIGLPFGSESPFKAEVYYINKAVAMDTKFALTPFNMIEPNFRVPIPVTSRGSFAVKVSDTKAFLNKLLGTVPDFEADTLKNYFRGIIVESVKSSITRIVREKNLSPLELEAIVFEVAAVSKQYISDTFAQFGLSIELFNVEAIPIIDEDPRVKRIVEDYQRLMSQDIEERMRLKRRAENIDIYKIERSFDTSEKAAENIGGGNDGGAGGLLGTMVGMGMVNPLANTMANIMGNATQPQAQTGNNSVHAPANAMGKDEVFKMLRELGELKSAGILTEEEFTEKKKELLSKI